MPTGYTTKVANGTITEFADFALECARAFGALVTLRDDTTAQIPEEITPLTYAQGRYEEKLKEYETLCMMTAAEVAAAAITEYEEAKLRREEYEKGIIETNARLDKILESVTAWEPPTVQHTELKKFMLQQLAVSREESYEQEPLVLKSPEDWFRERSKKLMGDIKYFAGEQAEEIARAKSRTIWLQKLRESLKTQ